MREVADEVDCLSGFVDRTRRHVVLSGENVLLHDSIRLLHEQLVVPWVGVAGCEDVFANLMSGANSETSVRMCDIVRVRARSGPLFHQRKRQSAWRTLVRNEISKKNCFFTMSTKSISFDALSLRNC